MLSRLMRIQREGERERCRTGIAAISFTANYLFTTPACAFNAIIIKNLLHRFIIKRP